MSDDISVDKLLRQATCAVLIFDEESQEDQVVGTAWLFSDQGHLLTAGHVLGKEQPLSQVRVQFGSEPPQVAELIHWVFEGEQKIDFAILKLADGAGQGYALPVKLAHFIEGRCRLYGYGKFLKGLTGGVADYVGTFGDERNRKRKTTRSRKASRRRKRKTKRKTKNLVSCLSALAHCLSWSRLLT